jgi:hypothetical protein
MAQPMDLIGAKFALLTAQLNSGWPVRSFEAVPFLGVEHPLNDARGGSW